MVVFKKLLSKILTWMVDTAAIQTWDYNDFTFNSGFKAYSGNEPTAVKYGRIVNLAGAYNTTAQQSTGAKTMGYIPSDCKPYTNVEIVAQGSGQNKFCLKINPEGKLTIENYGTTSAIAIPNNAWLNINATYLSAS